jgi:hypothetical protein
VLPAQVAEEITRQTCQQTEHESNGKTEAQTAHRFVTPYAYKQMKYMQLLDGAIHTKGGDND